MPVHPECERDSDEVLCIAFSGGNAAAGDLLIGRFIPLVRRRAYSFRGKGVESDDLIQEGLIGLLYAMRAYQPCHGAAFATFAYRCVTNRILSALASVERGTQAVSLDSCVARAESPGFESGDPQEILIEFEELERWRKRMLNLLSGFEKEALELYLSGHTYQEMAQALKSTTKAVDNALQRARRKLRVPTRGIF